jgi:hypothetical protein
MTALGIIEECRALGVEVLPMGENILIRPATKVPPELKARLREHKPEILVALRAHPAIGSKEARAETEKRIECRYDWQPGYRGLKLCCVSHKHDAGTTTVFRFLTYGRDVLLEMMELGILTGQAAEDAARVN